jgi:hypothetical protein
MALFATLTLKTASGDVVITLDNDGTVDLPALPNGWSQTQLRALFDLLDTLRGITTKYNFTEIHFVRP